jgi:hypothetical protein
MDQTTAITPEPKSQTKLIITLVAIIFFLVGLGILGLMYFFKISQDTKVVENSETTEVEEEEEIHVDEISTSTPADITKLPLGDQKYSNTPKVGYIYLCNTNLNGGGAFQAGPWINQAAKTWDLTKKVTIDGAVDWTNAKFSVSLGETLITLSGNGLPFHTTGIYPVQTSDDAYQYDRNPNSIKEQTILLDLPVNPTLAAEPSCMGGEVGIMLSGIAMFNGFDAGGRDAAAWEIQDECGGHPQVAGQYHYHSNSDCIDDHSEEDEHSALVGYALDGFGIYGNKSEGGKEVSTVDLDVCHGHTHEILWNGKLVEMYHYHLTSDFPYSVSCFRGTPVRKQIIEGQQGEGMTPMPQMPPRKM